MRKTRNIFKFLFFALAICLLMFCEKDVAPYSDNTPPPPTPTAINLIANGSFEDSVGNVSFKKWFGHCNQYPINWDSITSMKYFEYDSVQNTPQGGGKWALKISGFQQSIYAMAYITGYSGTNVFELNFWAKCIYSVANPGKACIQILSPSWPTGYQKCLQLDTTNVWKKYTLKDTLVTQPNDTIIIMLWNGSSGPTSPPFYFDLIEFKKTNP